MIAPTTTTCTVPRLLTSKRLFLTRNNTTYPQIAYLSVNDCQTYGCWQSELERYIQCSPTAYLKNPSVSYLAVGDDDLAKSGAELERRDCRRLYAVL